MPCPTELLYCAALPTAARPLGAQLRAVQGVLGLCGPQLCGMTQPGSCCRLLNMASNKRLLWKPRQQHGQNLGANSTSSRLSGAHLQLDLYPGVLALGPAVEQKERP